MLASLSPAWALPIALGFRLQGPPLIHPAWPTLPGCSGHYPFSRILNSSPLPS